MADQLRSLRQQVGESASAQTEARAYPQSPLKDSKHSVVLLDCPGGAWPSWRSGDHPGRRAAPRPATPALREAAAHIGVLSIRSEETNSTIIEGSNPSRRNGRSECRYVSNDNARP